MEFEAVVEALADERLDALDVGGGEVRPHLDDDFAAVRELKVEGICGIGCDLGRSGNARQRGSYDHGLRRDDRERENWKHKQSLGQF